MWVIFLILVLLSPIALIVALIKPNLFTRIFRHELNRKQLSGIFGALLVVSFILFGFTAPDAKSNPSVVSESQEKNGQSVPEASVPVPQQPTQVSPLYQVVKVIDGDTFDVTIDGKVERIRLIGIDTPETVDPRKPVECFGKEASAKAKELLVGQKVRLEADNTQDNRDKYDRLLRYAFLENGTHFNKVMISEGYAHEYTYDLPYKYQAEFRQAETEARNAKRGLWADNVCGTTANLSPVQPTSQQSVSAPAPSSAVADKDCPDFSTHAEAQAFFEAQGGPAQDPHRLDGDHDGLACETLP